MYLSVLTYLWQLYQDGAQQIEEYHGLIWRTRKAQVV
jgi:hypothetical protein